jgi:hypothetical protein
MGGRSMTARHGFRGGYPRHRLMQAQTARLKNAKLLDKRHTPRSPPETVTNIRFGSVLRQIELRAPDAPTAIAPAEPYCRIAEAIARVADGGISECILCWPAPNLSLAAGFALAVAGRWSDCDPIPLICGLSVPRPLRALYFPWSTRTRVPLKNIYVCKDALKAVHLNHMQRYPTGPGDDRVWFELHATLIRVKDLNGLGRDGRTHLELMHPALYELVPSGPCAGKEHRTSLLDRVRSKTQLRVLSTSHLIDDPATAPYYLFGAYASDRPGNQLNALPGSVDVILLDLTRTGRNRFSDDWAPSVTKVIAAAKARFGRVPILAVTDDPWVHRDLIWRHLKPDTKPHHRQSAKETAVFATSRSITAPAAPLPTYSGCARITARGFAGNLDGLLDRISQLKARASKIGDAPAHTLLADLASLLRRCANLPGGVSDLGSYVAREAGDVRAIHIMAAYQAPKLIADIERLEGALAQSRRGLLTELCGDARRAWNNQCDSSPMAELLVEVLKPYFGNSSKTVVLFRKQMLSDYAESALKQHPEIGPAIERRLGNGMLRFVDAIGFHETTTLPPSERHQTTTAIVVSPTRQQILALMADPWLPSHVLVLADAKTLAATARDAEQLARYPAFQGFAERLQKLKSATAAASEIVTGSKVSLGPEVAPPPDTDFPTTKLVDLSGTSRSANELIVKLETDDSQTILARQGTRLVAYDDTGAVPAFRPLSARDADIGDAICVINDDFVDMARITLDISHAACEEMRAYHQLVHALYKTVPGDSDRAKRQHLAACINQGRGDDDLVLPSTIAYWVHLEDQLSLPLEEVTPHAPQHWSTFERFMTALGVARPLAERYWNWAVIHTRSNRLKAAHRLHDAYLGVLISPHAGEAENPTHVADIRALRAAAEGFVAHIRSKSIIERGRLCA